MQLFSEVPKQTDKKSTSTHTDLALHVKLKPPHTIQVSLEKRNLLVTNKILHEHLIKVGKEKKKMRVNPQASHLSYVE